MQIHDQIKVMQAFAEGKAIEWSDAARKDPVWYPCNDPLWNWVDNNYRIKPEPTDKEKNDALPVPEGFEESTREVWHGAQDAGEKWRIACNGVFYAPAELREVYRGVRRQNLNLRYFRPIRRKRLMTVEELEQLRVRKAIFFKCPEYPERGWQLVTNNWQLRGARGWQAAYVHRPQDLREGGD